MAARVRPPGVDIKRNSYESNEKCRGSGQPLHFDRSGLRCSGKLLIAVTPALGVSARRKNGLPGERRYSGAKQKGGGFCGYLVLNSAKRLPAAARVCAFIRRSLIAAIALPNLHLLRRLHVRLNGIEWHIICASD
jgi:hypothetical protein